MKYKLSTKLESGKWWAWGNVAENQFGKLQCSFKVTPDLIKLFKSKEGAWVNFSMFEDDRVAKKEEEPVDAHNQAKANAYQQPANHLLDDSIPFSPRYWF